MKVNQTIQFLFRRKVIQKPIFFLRNIIPFIIHAFAKPLEMFNNNKHLFQNISALEIGGPTPLFQQKSKIFPIYDLFSSLDNCNFNEDNFWSNIARGDKIKVDKRSIGKQIIGDASDLRKISGASYDMLINSHVIEHIANPLKALVNWKRVIKENGYLLMVVPHKDGTYDHKRPVTTMEHIIADYTTNIQEDDTTHFHEIIELHDLDLDTTVKDYDDHVKRTNDNFNKRIVHHHVFDTNLVVKMVDYVGFKVIDVQQLKPYNIIILAQKKEVQQGENNDFFDKKNRLYSDSPFYADRN